MTFASFFICPKFFVHCEWGGGVSVFNRFLSLTAVSLLIPISNLYSCIMHCLWSTVVAITTTNTGTSTTSTVLMLLLLLHLLHPVYSILKVSKYNEFVNHLNLTPSQLFSSVTYVCRVMQSPLTLFAGRREYSNVENQLFYGPPITETPK